MDGHGHEVSEKKRAIAAMIRQPLAALAGRCRQSWTDVDKLDQILNQGLASLPCCSRLYAVTPAFIQLSSNVGRRGIDTGKRSQDLGERPYLISTLPYRGFILSSVYIDRLGQHPCITAIQAVNAQDRLLGFILADFRLQDLPLEREAAVGQVRGQQFRGDPAIRGTLFAQERVHSSLDERIDDTHAMLLTLMAGHGVFHCKLHYSSSRLTLWLMDEPHSYRVHTVHEVLDPEICLAYPPRRFPGRAIVAPATIDSVFTHFRSLRTVDTNIYLRAGSLNVINGMVGLTFSCDGSYYLPVDEFIDRRISYWTGTEGDS